VFLIAVVWSFAMPQKAQAAGEPLVCVVGDSAVEVYVNYPGSATTVTAPTWTEYAPPTAVNGQDDLYWHPMTSGSWTVNGSSYNWHVTIPYSDHLNQSGL
jgi:hypothetical protein